MMIRRSLLFFLLLSISFTIQAQSELGTHLMRGLWQANQTNPALLPGHMINIGVGGAYTNLQISNLTFNDVISERTDGTNVIDIDKAIELMGDNNFIRESFQIETLSLGLAFGRLNIFAGHQLRFNAYLNYPKTLPQLVWNGNAQFIGQEINFAPNVQLFAYNEFAVGAAYEINEMITIGGKVKYLSGVADASSEGSRLNLLTDEISYQLTLDADYRVNSSGTLTYDGFDDVDFNFESGEFDASQLFSSNAGFAFDIGAHLNFGRLDVAISALDIGSINWEEDVNNYTLNGNYEYLGLDVVQDILDDTTTVGSVVDSLRESYDVRETNEAYSTVLPTRFYLSSTYLLNNRVSLGGVVYGERYRDEFFLSFGVGADIFITDWLRAGALYAVRDDSYTNIGINAAVNLGPIQLMAATDNILAAFQPKDTNSANLRVGLNFVFRPKSEEIRNIDDISDQDRFFNNKPKF